MPSAKRYIGGLFRLANHKKTPVRSSKLAFENCCYGFAKEYLALAPGRQLPSGC
jgi:hypothetical protein